MGLVAWLVAGCGSSEVAERLPPPSVPGPSRSADRGGELGALPGLPDVAERAIRSVVSVSVRRSSPFVPTAHAVRPAPAEPSTGSGVVLARGGLVVTSAHVVADAEAILVSAWDGRTAPARLVGADPSTDVALIAVGGKLVGLEPLAVGDSDLLRIGQPVVAIGNPYGVGQTVTLGVIGGLGRTGLGLTDYEDFIQTDAGIHPGNSGGALLDLHGNLVGMNTAVYGRGEGIGYAIPMSLVVPIVAQLQERGFVEPGWLGAAVTDPDPDARDALGLPEQTGVVVTTVTSGSPAARAGIRAGDVVLGLDGKRVTHSAGYRAKLAALGAGHDVSVRVVRDGWAVESACTLAPVPGERSSTPAPGRVELAHEVQLESLSKAIREEHDLPFRLRGVWVTAVDPRGRLARAGLRPHDVVVDLGGVDVSDARALAAALVALDGAFTLGVYRGGEKLEVTVGR